MKKPSFTKKNIVFFLCLCITKFLLAAAPVNDNCNNATSLTISNSCTTIPGTLASATNTTGLPTPSCVAAVTNEVWYKFMATSSYVTITLSNIGTNISGGGGTQGKGAVIDLLTGTCGSFVNVTNGCATGTGTSLSLTQSGLTVGTTYYIIIYTKANVALTTNANFDICITALAASRMNEVFQPTILSGVSVLNTPWEVTYGPDDYLWVTDSHGYKAYRMDPNTGAKTTILDISNGATDFPSYDVGFLSTQNPWPQGGFAGLAIHPQFNSGKPYVYISYVKTFVGGSNGPGYFFTNSLVRFTYNSSTGKLESPTTLCDTLPGSSDHNSQRLIIVPVGGTYYLFYPQGDMGAGQLTNSSRTNNAQNLSSYEGKILRFNLDSTGSGSGRDKWIPDDNPYNGASKSAIWAVGIRNNQGWAYDTTLGILYGASHGPYSDDEINIIEEGKNYGHPWVIGYAADGNYNGSDAGTPNNSPASTLSVITDEVAAAAAIPNYKDPLFSGYAPNQTTLHNIWVTNPGNGTWPSEAWSGMDIYKNTIIPGWKNSLVLAGLKWGRVLRLKLGPTGTTIVPTNGADTVAYFQSKNRFRDLAFAPNGKDIFVSMESSTSSGPAAGTATVPQCTNCIVKYTFLGYADAGGKSSIPDAIDVTDATVNTVDSATTVTIDNTNNNLWVPITGPDGNIMAEIYANGNNLGTIHSAFYKHSGAIRIKSGIRYLDRNMTITPQTQPVSTVKIRLYISKAEYDALDANPFSGVSAITDLKILKNQDVSRSSIASSTTLINPTFAEAHGTDGYVLQGDISSFSSFYFASSNIILPLNLLTFKGSLLNNAALLEWETTNEVNTSYFIIERSTDGHSFLPIGTTPARGNNNKNDYSFTDNEVMHQSSLLLYYRLKMVDNDGAYTYSSVVTISLPSITGNVTVFPNPASHKIAVTITVPSDGKVQWNVTDNAGRIVIQNAAELKKGNNSLSINVGNLSTGLYYLNVSGAGIDEKVKVEKL